MATVRKTIDVTKPFKITKKMMAELEAAKKLPTIFDEDCPELTDKQIAEFAETIRLQRANKVKQTVSLRLSAPTLLKVKKFGKGYTTVLSKIIESALNNPKILKECL